MKTLLLVTLLSFSAAAAMASDYPQADPDATQNDLAAAEMGREHQEYEDHLTREQEDFGKELEEQDRTRRENEKIEDLQKQIDKLNCEKTSSFCQ